MKGRLRKTGRRSGASETPYVKSAVRALEILDYFSIIRRPASVSDVERALGFPQSSASVLLRSLAASGYLEYLPKYRQFRPTLRIAVLGDWLKHGLAAGPLSEQLEALQRKTRETVILGRRQGAQVQFITILPAERDLQFYMRRGVKRLLTISAVGRALLSTMADSAALRIIRRCNAESRRPGDRVDEALLMECLHEIRRSNISETDIRFGGPQDFHVVGTLIPRDAAEEQLALGVAGPAARMMNARKEVIDLLRASVSQ